MIKRKILEKVATFSTSPEFEEDDEASTSVTDSVDPDIVLTNGSDSSEGKVVANSVDGEDGIVDVTMKESNGVRESVEKDAPKSTAATQTSKPSFNRRRPKFLQPGSYLNPALQNMFDLGYFSGPKDSVPTGWSEVDEDRNYPSIASRNPRLQRTYEDESGNDFDMANGRTGSESSNDDDQYPSNTLSSATRMNDESSEEDEPSLPKPNVSRAHFRY
jgi:ubiquitin carboxyl-terminal hydrolase 4/11/15